MTRSALRHSELEDVLAVAFTPRSTYRSVSPDGKWILECLAADFAGRTVQVWDLKTGVIMGTCKHTKAVNTITFSPDSKRILSASDDNTVQVHTLESLFSQMQGRTGLTRIWGLLSGT